MCWFNGRLVLQVTTAIDPFETAKWVVWASPDRPERPSRFAAQFMLNVSFVETSAMSVVCLIQPNVLSDPLPFKRLDYSETSQGNFAGYSAIGRLPHPITGYSRITGFWVI